MCRLCTVSQSNNQLIYSNLIWLYLLESVLTEMKQTNNFSSRFPWLVPPLNESYVAKETVSAVLTNRKSVVMPCIMHIVLWARRLVIVLCGKKLYPVKVINNNLPCDIL